MTARTLTAGRDVVRDVVRDVGRGVVLEGIGFGRVFGEGDLALRVLHPATVRIARGEVTVIMGPSGSGKTTLLSILGLVLTPTEGEVRFAGTRVSGASADALAAFRRQQIGFVFQQFNLIAGLTALENAALPLVPASERDRRATAALAHVGLADRAAMKPRSLSGGQQQRVAIARALVSEAPVILCDEPTASLDHASGDTVLTLLRQLAVESARAVVVVTHDERVLSIADRVLDVVDGHVHERVLPHAVGQPVAPPSLTRKDD